MKGGEKGRFTGPTVGAVDKGVIRASLDGLRRPSIDRQIPRGIEHILVLRERISPHFPARTVPSSLIHRREIPQRAGRERET
ncbi:hypothetical protein CROQUDRAFT_100462 [Cronartium quercuum f. sp. fusiforme G11]|uniref:Uncharacterized protein n=1 Tax=Cronartium quercuum f. sp. fusiforme G11 TaxID=708437 RepID=A0A9P6N648_9BASI|nr:hypothetical protein CROQUDRAFT_100462 [Cronartium quercuum f. sp. fusiforme G11]